MSIWRQTGLVVFGIICFFGFVLFQELAIRLALPKFDPVSHVRFVASSEERPLLGPPDQAFRQIKNTGDFDVIVRFNRHGFRDDLDVSEGQREDLYVVGDSFPFGWGVAEDARVSERLEKIVGGRVFNLATGGDIEDFNRSLRYAESLGAQIESVILFLDLEIAVRIYSDHDVQETPVIAPEPRSLLLQRVKHFLAQNSATYFAVTSIIHQSQMLRSVAVNLGLIVPTLDAVNAVELSDAAIVSTVEEIELISKRYELLVAVMGHRALWSGNEKELAQQQLQTIKAELSARNIRYVDLAYAFEATTSPLQLYFKNDGHWNEDGHAIAATAIAPHVSDHKTHEDIESR